jgi:hypothetical protein
VFLDDQGKPATEKTIGDHATRLAKIGHRGIHIPRRTFCSHLAMRGAPPQRFRRSPDMQT